MSMTRELADDTARMILRIERLTKAFGGVSAIDGVNLGVAEGEMRCIIGPNGAGKSTLFQLIVGRIQPDEGRIYFRSGDITRSHMFQRANLGIGIKFQNLNVYQDLTVRHNLIIPFQHRYEFDALDDAISEML